ncbi:hypothetical protein ONZ45_g484 [Pleurotus djamor]|nr:hypothetical protein ONZ45_g484 [Pleurotus djamor]
MLQVFAKHTLVPLLWRPISTCPPEARRLILSVLEGQPQGLRSQDIYAEAMKEDITIEPIPIPKSVPGPPNPNHPIRSMKYLKRVVLEELQKEKLIVKTHLPLQEPVTKYVHKKGKLRKAVMNGEWRWKLVEFDSAEETKAKNENTLV